MKYTKSILLPVIFHISCLSHTLGFFTTIPFPVMKLSHIPLKSHSKNIDATVDKRKTVVKFGGSSLNSPERIQNVGNILKDMILNGVEPVVVCSALGDTTTNILNIGSECINKGFSGIDEIRKTHLYICDNLEIDMSTKQDVLCLLDEMESILHSVSVIGELSDRNRDKIVSFGERMSVRIISSFLRSIGMKSDFFEAGSIGLVTTDVFGNSEILDEAYTLIYEYMSTMETDLIPVITGFLGETKSGNITTLGRGGSDLTATTIGVAIGAVEVQVWKDVDGMMTMDPRMISSAVSVPRVSYEEATELAYFGGNILHPISMRPLIGKEIPIRIKNSYNPEHPGTLITSEKSNCDNLVTAITFKRGIDLIDIVSTHMLGQSGFLSRVFYQFFKYSLSIDMIATSDVSISLTLDMNQDRDSLRKCMQEIGDIADVTGHRNHASISLISDISRSSEVMSEVFRVLKEEDVKVYMISQGASKVNIGIIVSEEDLEKAIRSLHRHFFE